MIYIPHDLSALAEGHPLVAYLRADPTRRRVLEGILPNLEAGGLVGDYARYHIVRNDFRRDIFRAVLDCLGLAYPVWAERSPLAASANRAFIRRFRGKFNAYRVAAREQPRPSTAALHDQKSHNQREATRPHSLKGNQND